MLPSFFANRTIQSRIINVPGRPEFHWLLDPEELIDRCILGGVWECASTIACTRWVKPGMTCIDAGANIGYYTILLSYLAGPEGHVHAFEPMADACALAQLHARMNIEHCANTKVWNAGLSDENIIGEAHFNYSWHPTRRERTKGIAPQHTIDTLFHDTHIDFIKLDVDGYEDRIINGGAATLQRCKTTLLLEVCDYTLRDAARLRHPEKEYVPNAYARVMLERLRSYGYSFLREEHDEPIDLETTLSLVDLSKSSVNILCILS